MEISDTGSEQRFDDSMSSLSSLKYMIELNKQKKQKWCENIQEIKRMLKYSIVM